MSLPADTRLVAGNDGESAAARRRFAVSLTAGFALLTLPRLLAHEPWRDEAWLWLVVTESRSLDELWAPLARSGQGYLFPLLCFLARQASTSWRAMQLLNLVLASAAAFAVGRWAPFHRWQRALLVLGYFPFYEYGVLSRHYGLGMLLLWLACSAARSRRPALGVGVALGLLCQTTVYGYLLAAAVAGGWLLDRWLRRRELRRQELRRNELAALPRAETVAGAAAFLAGAAVGLAQLIPKSDTSFASGWNFGWQPELLARVAQMAWRALVPLPRPELHFWNTNALDAWPAAQTLAGLAMLGFALALLWPRKTALITFIVGGAGLAAFGYVKYLGVLRHQGHWWLLFVAALWLADGMPERGRRPSWRAAAFTALLVVHVAAALFASWMDLRQPFSNAGRVAERIRDQRLDELPLLGYREPPAAPVALALGRPLYSPARGVFTTHPDWGPLQRDLSIEELRCAARKLAARERRDVVLVMNRELPPWPEVDDAGAVVGAIVATEDYHLYRLRHARLPATAQEAACPPP